MAPREVKPVTDFWEGGQRSYIRALETERDDELAPLEKAFQEAIEPPEQARLLDAIKDVNARCEQRKREADGFLF